MKQLIDEGGLPAGWERVIGRNTDEDTVTVFTGSTGWFDVQMRSGEDGAYVVTVVRGPGHPRQDEMSDALREQTNVAADSVETVAVAFMLTASDMDPFTNQFTRGTTL